MDSATLSAPALPLTSRHLAELRDSGLTDETIATAGLRSLDNPVEIARLLHWDRAAKRLGSCLIFPYHSLSGEYTGLSRIKPGHPRRNKDGKACKYEQPRNTPPQPYFTGSLDGIEKNGRVIVVITESEKKSLLLRQCGFAAIGLSGIWSWQVPRKETDEKGRKIGARKLLPELAAIDWTDKLVAVVFDTDPRRNPSVEYAKCELCRVLSEHGASVRSVSIPIIRGPDGMAQKMGVDDYFMAANNGFVDPEEGIKDLVLGAFEDAEVQSLDGLRRKMRDERIGSLGASGVYLDRSPTGSGKTRACVNPIRRIRHEGLSHISVPTHDQAEEAWHECLRQGIDAGLFPKLCRDTCQNFDEAELAMKCGLRIVFPTSEFQTKKPGANCSPSISVQPSVSSVRNKKRSCGPQYNPVF